ncbi:MAG TPA: hypothetical protein VFJ09_04360 [Nocardioidaceae bacterium]|nr:hypothetical protein [Nocardioidaceae bacterium]
METRRRWAPAAASLAVLAVVVGTWTLAGPDQSPRPVSSTPSPLPSLTAGGFIGGPPRTPAGASSHPPVTVSRGVAIDGYTLLDPTHLLISYTIGVSSCYGVIDQPLVQESWTAVTVTLTRKPAKTSDGSCPSITLMEAVHVTLSAPLGKRVVRDGATGGTPVPEGPRPPP